MSDRVWGCISSELKKLEVADRSKSFETLFKCIQKFIKIKLELKIYGAQESSSTAKSSTALTCQWRFELFSMLMSQKYREISVKNRFTMFSQSQSAVSTGDLHK